MRADKYWNDLLYSLTDDDMKIRASEIRELGRTEVREFFILLNAFKEKLKYRQDELNKKNAG